MYNIYKFNTYTITRTKDLSRYLFKQYNLFLKPIMDNSSLSSDDKYKAICKIYYKLIYFVESNGCYTIINLLPSCFHDKSFPFNILDYSDCEYEK